jgi:hypothetical protein
VCPRLIFPPAALLNELPVTTADRFADQDLDGQVVDQLLVPRRRLGVSEGRAENRRGVGRSRPLRLVEELDELTAQVSQSLTTALDHGPRVSQHGHGGQSARL